MQDRSANRKLHTFQYKPLHEVIHENATVFRAFASSVFVFAGKLSSRV